MSAPRVDDGTEDVSSDAERCFHMWLERHGARFPKLEWPARSTVDGVRGVVCRADVETGVNSVVSNILN
jgi:hypothetical protein